MKRNRIYTLNIILVCKYCKIPTITGYRVFKKGTILWKGKPNQKSWNVSRSGFVLPHWYGYNQSEIIPWEFISLRRSQVEETILRKSKIIKILNKEDLKL